MSRAFWFRSTIHLLIATLYAQQALAYVPAWARARDGARSEPARVAAAPGVSGDSSEAEHGGGNGGNGGGGGAQTTLFGPKRYTRTAGPPNRFSDPVVVPAWAGTPFKLKIVNGEANGSHRVTSGTVTINGQTVARPSDFKKAAYVIERQVTLTPGSTVTLDVELQSTPGNFLTINVSGVNRDTRPPTVTIAQPAPSSTITDTTPALSVTYADQTGSGTSTQGGGYGGGGGGGGGTAPASGVDVATFQAILDGVDRTSWFTTTATGATAVVPDTSALSAGAHTLIAKIKDKAGNLGTATATFTVQTGGTQPPTVTINEPADGLVTREASVVVAGSFTEHTGGAATVQCRNGTTSNPAQLSGSNYTCSVALNEGANRIDVVVTDSRGITGQAFRNVTRDSTPPTIEITSPAANSYTADTAITVRGTVTGATAVTVNGVTATVTGEEFEALDVPVGGPTTTLIARATDAAGNPAVDSVTITFVSTPLEIKITSPEPGAVLHGPLVEIRGTVSRDVPSTVTVNNENVTPANGEFVIVVPLTEGEQTVVATARDEAGRTDTDQVTLRIDSLEPVITLLEPADGLVTNAPQLTIAGTVTDASASDVTLTLTVNNQPVPIDPPGPNGQFSVTVPLPAADGPVAISLVATDPAGNESDPKQVTVRVDRAAPTLTIVSPTPNQVVTGFPVVVQGTVSEAGGSTAGITVTVDGVAAEVTNGAWQASFDSLPDSEHTFVVVARDAAGNQVPREVTVRLDSAPPVITITSPAPGTLTQLGTIQITGTVQDLSTVTVKVDEHNGEVTGGTFTVDVPLAADGDYTLVVTATDAGNRSSEASVLVTRDSTAPALALAGPDRLTRRQPGQAVATVTDAVGVAQVVFSIDNVPAATITEAPFTFALVVPEGIELGDTFKVTATATDRAGNVSTDDHDVRVTADGAIVAQVLSDATGLPLPGATVLITAGATTDERTSDAQGRYTLPTEQASVALTATKDNMTSVTRVVSMTSGVGTIPVDARLTPLAAPVTIGTAGGPLTTGTAGTLAAVDATVTVTVPANAVATDTPFQLTALSPQGLPELLPLGWSPVTAFDLRSTGSVSGLLDVTMTLARPSQTFPNQPAPTLALVQHRPVLHTWVVVARNLTVTDGRVTAQLPGAGAFALVVADAIDPPLAVPEEGSALIGVGVVDLPITTTTQSVVSPAVIPPTGGTARGELAVNSPVAVPSGTVVQTEITETFTLPSGQVASEEMRRADVILYRTPRRDAATTPPPAPDPQAVPALGAMFPITPSRTFDPTELLQGRVHLDILAGRESARGVTGGLEAITVNADGARLIVPGAALDDDTAIVLRREQPSSFLPTHGAVTRLAELTIDFGGQTLEHAAELSIGANGATTGSFVIAQVDRVDGVPHLTAVALAEVQGDRIVPKATPGLPGVTRGGRYVFYRVEGTAGLISGFTRGGTEAVLAIVSTDLAPFIARSATNGRYTVVTLTGAATVTARVPRTSLQKQGSVTVAEGQLAELDLILAPSITSATITPVHETSRLPRHTQVQLTTSTPIQPKSLEDTATIRLLQETASGDVLVPTRVVLAGSRQLLSIVPVAALAAGATYRAEVAGLTDIFGGPIASALTRFHTAAEAAPDYTADDLTFSFPNAQGFVTIAAEEGSFPAGTEFLIINSTSGEVVTFTAANDGSVNFLLRATIQDRLVITITDPDGRVTTLTRSQYVDSATGRTAIGSGGGVVKGPGGLELRVPEGAVTRAVTLQLTPLTEAAFEPKPALKVDGAQFGGGVTLTSADKPTFQHEVDLAFPVPDNLRAEAARLGLQVSDAFFYVFRKLEGPNGKIYYETIDYARLEGTGADARIVTASCPYAGITNVFGSFGQGVVNAMIETHYLVLWTLEQARLAKPKTGMITGYVQQQEWERGRTSPRLVGVPNVVVWGEDASGLPLEDQAGAIVAITQTDGRYALYDNRFAAGNFTLHTAVKGVPYEQIVSPLTTDVVADACVTIVRTLFEAIGTANFTIAALEPPPPAPSLTIKLFETKEGKRVDTRGLAIEDTALTIGVSANDPSSTITAIEVRRIGEAQGESFVIHADPARQTTPPDPMAMDVVTQDTWTPAQPGAFEIAATALPAFGAPVTSTISVRVVAGGGVITTDPDNRPAVITAQTVPAADAAGVPVVIFPQIAFTEPVRNIPDNVELLDSIGAVVPVRISGVGIDAQGQRIVIEDVNNSSMVLTSLTVQPLAGLSFGTRYRLVLKSDIIDLDTPAKPLLPYETAFTTFAPEELGGTAQAFPSPGFAVLGDRAYVLETYTPGGVSAGQTGALRTFNISDPVRPVEIPPAVEIGAPPRDISGDQLLAGVVTMPTTRFAAGPGTSTSIVSGPSNLLVYDVSGPTPQWIGAATLTMGVMDGVPNRVVLKDSMAYIATPRKGIQVVDLSKTLLGELANEPPWQQHAKLYAPGTSGVNPEALAAEMALSDPDAPTALTYPQDLKVGDYTVEGRGRRLVLTTGRPAAIGLVIVDPLENETIWQGALVKDEDSLAEGASIAIGRVAGRELALVGGYGTVAGAGATGVVAVVDLTPLVSAPRGEPTVLAFVPLSHGASDVVILDQTAIVSSGTGVATLINLRDPSAPKIVGALAGVGSRLAQSNSVLFSTNRTFLQGQPSPLGGLRTATFGVIGSVRPHRASFTKLIVPPGPTPAEPTSEETLNDVPMSLDVYPRSTPVQQGKLSLFMNGTLQQVTDVAITSGEGLFTLTKGFQRPKDVVTTAVLEFVTADGVTVRSAPRRIELGRVSLRVDSNNDTVIVKEGLPQDAADEAAAKANKPFVFWEADLNATKPGDATVDYATLFVRLKAQAPHDAKVFLRWTNANWELHRQATLEQFNGKLPTGCVPGDEIKLRFCNPRSIQLQDELMAMPAERAPIRHTGGDFEIPVSLLARGENGFMFRCLARTNGQRACAAPAIEVGQMENGQFEKLADARVDVKPFRQLATWVSFRGAPDVSSFDYYKVGAVPQISPDWAELPAATTEVPGTVAVNTVNFIVHGYFVHHADFVEGMSGTPAHFLTWAKRLYWTGQPVLQAQGAHTIGVEWPGDVPGPNPLPGRDDAEPYFPDDEFNAFQTGVPLGKLIAQMREPAGRKINILAHSLGNIVVHSALQRMESNSTNPITFMMNQAALTAEALSTNYQLTDYDKKSDVLLEKAKRMGYDPRGPASEDTDKIWRLQQQEILGWSTDFACSLTDPLPSEYCPLPTDNSTGGPQDPPCYDPVRCAAVRKYQAQAEEVEGRFTPAIDFTRRWGQVRQSIDDRGPWRGVFAGNLQLPGVKIFNSFNPTDFTLRVDVGQVDWSGGFPGDNWGRLPVFDIDNIHSWLKCQVAAKPFVVDVTDVPPIGFGTDRTDEQKWTLLMRAGTSANDDPERMAQQRGIWGGNVPGNWASITRGWAELAYWFPAIAAPAGAQSLKVLEQMPNPDPNGPLVDYNINLGEVGGDLGDLNGTVLSHSYMRAKPFTEVWKGWVEIAKKFKQ